MAYDSESDRIILFGGETEAGSNVLNDETWAFDLNNDTWERLDPNPGPRSRFAHAMAYDEASDRIILFGGWTGTEQGNETWAYNYNTNTWANLTPATSPPAAVYVRMEYDTQSRRTVLFGGAMNRNPVSLSSETWAYDPDLNAWTKMNPSAFPAGRGGYGMTYDRESDRIVLFGGRDTVRDFNDTWAYDYNRNTWTQMSPETAPSARHALGMAYDADSDGVILFGGFTVTGGGAGGDETWVYNLNTDAWALADKGSGPSGREGAVMAYDNQSHQMVLVGGWPGGDETWSHRFVAPPPSLPWVYIAIGVAVGAVVAVVASLLIRRGRGKQGTGP